MMYNIAVEHFRRYSVRHMVRISFGVFSQCIRLYLLLFVVKNFWQTNCVALSTEESQATRRTSKVYS